MDSEKQRSRRATISDVAAKANVSIGTVSRFINGLPVRDGNRSQVQRAIEELSFRPNASARAMKNETTNIVGLLVPEYDEFHAGLFEHLEKLLKTDGYMMLAYCHNDRDGLIDDAVAFFAGQNVDALIMAGSLFGRDTLEKLSSEGVPTVIYNNDVLGMNLDRIFVENRRASRRAVKYLLDLGHRRIGLISGNREDSTGERRHDGYASALRESVFDVDPDLIQDGMWTVEGGYSAVERLMALPEPPTAIFSANYKMTYGVLEWAREHRRSIPKDFSLVSFDDVELFRLYGEGITAIAQPIQEISENIASSVLTRLSGRNVASTTSRTLQCDLIQRGSCRPLSTQRSPDGTC